MRNGHLLSELQEQSANFTDEDFTPFEVVMERRGRAVAPMTTATAPKQRTNMGRLVHFPLPKLKGRGNLGNPTIVGGRGWEKNIPFCMENVTKRAPPGGGIKYPVSGCLSLP